MTLTFSWYCGKAIKIDWLGNARSVETNRKVGSLVCGPVEREGIRCYVVRIDGDTRYVASGMVAIQPWAGKAYQQG